MLQVGVDLMGGDRPPAHLFQGVMDAAHRCAQVQWVSFLTPSAYNEIISLNPHLSSSFHFRLVNEVIGMEDEPLVAIRKKKDSSLVKGLREVAEGNVEALISVGNTGALIAGARLFIDPFPSMRRLALLAHVPTQREDLLLIDAGGSPACTPLHLLQFVRFAAAYANSHGRRHPKVALLNMGREWWKGTPSLRESALLFNQHASSLEIEFIGNREAHEVFRGDIDILVTDGFAGNVFLKTCEGIVRLLLEDISPHSSQWLARERKEGGALVAGIEKVVLKCHGHASPDALSQALQEAVRLIRAGTLPHIKRVFAHFPFSKLGNKAD